MERAEELGGECLLPALRRCGRRDPAALDGAGRYEPAFAFSIGLAAALAAALAESLPLRLDDNLVVPLLAGLLLYCLTLTAGHWKAGGATKRCGASGSALP